jgi:hypothetical protein
MDENEEKQLTATPEADYDSARSPRGIILKRLIWGSIKL